MGLLLPRQIGSLRLGDRLGEGGMALVFRATDRFKPDEALAVKLLRPEVHGDADLVRRFLREGEVLTRLRHPHLVEVHAHGRSGSWPYLAMELLPRGSVKACLGEPPAQLVRRFLGPLEALGMAHGAGVVHRDLKPSNLLFAADGRLKVTDFGVCLWEGDGGTRVTRSQMVVGTVGYMAPEQHGDPRRVDGRCDVYAVGAILYELTTGQAYAQVQLPPDSARPGYPVKLARVLVQALAPDPARRLPSMAAFHGALSEWLESAEAAGWGEVPLPGFQMGIVEGPTQASTASPVSGGETTESRLAPYLDGLASGPVGARRAAADGLLRSLQPDDEPFLLAALGGVPEGARFAVCQALGRVGGEAALEPLRNLLGDPFARTEAAEALSLIALRTGREGEVREVLGGAGDPGDPWRWAPRARLGDARWVQGVLRVWGTLPPNLRVQALEAARLAPEAQRLELRETLLPQAGSAALVRMVEGL